MAGISESRSHFARPGALLRRLRLTGALESVRRTAGPPLRALLDRLGLLWAVVLRRLPQRFHAITDEVAKFGTIGLINLGVNFAVFNALLVVVAGSEVKAKAVATIVAATSAYFLNRYWTYRHRPKTTLRREYSLFFFFNAVGLLIETSIVALAKYGFDQTNWLVLNICTFFGIAIGTVFRFWAYRTHVFKPAPAVEESSRVLTAGVPAAVAEPESAVDPAGVARVDAASADVAPVDARSLDVPSVETAPADATPAPMDAVAADLAPEGLTSEDDDLADELVELELNQILRADDPVRR